MKTPGIRFRTPLDYVQRQWERTYLSFETLIKTRSGFQAPVRVINFSHGGFLLACDAPLKRGDEIEIELAGIGEVCGRIAWVRGGQVGGQFDSVIKAAELVAAIETRQSVVPVSEDA